MQGQKSRADLTPCACPAPAALLPVLSPGCFPPPPPPLTSPCCVYLCSHATPCCLACRATTAPQLRAHEPSARHLWVHPGGQHRKNRVPGGTGDAVLHLYCTCTAALRRRNSRPARLGCLLAPVHAARATHAARVAAGGTGWLVCFAGRMERKPKGRCISDGTLPERAAVGCKHWPPQAWAQAQSQTPPSIIALLHTPLLHRHAAHATPFCRQPPPSQTHSRTCLGIGRMCGACLPPGCLLFADPLPSRFRFPAHALTLPSFTCPPCPCLSITSPCPPP